MTGKEFRSETAAALPPRAVFIVEDHPLFRAAMAQLLSAQRDLTVCGTAANAAQALRGICRLKPDVALLDISLPGKSGLELVQEIRAAGLQTRLLVISIHDEALYAERVLRAGGDGYIMKEQDPEDVVRAIREVLAGRIYVGERLQGKSPRNPSSRSPARKPRPLDHLSDGELEVLESLGWGKTFEQVGGQLGLTAASISSLCRRMREKLKLKTNNALLRYAACWVETGET